MHLLFVCLFVFYMFRSHTMTDNSKLDELVRKGRAVAAALDEVYDRSQMDALIKKKRTDPAQMDLCQIVKQGQMIFQALGQESSKNNLYHLLKESREMFDQPNKSDPKVQPVMVK